MQGKQVIPASIRPIIRRFAAVVCPPDHAGQQLMPALLDGFGLYLQALPPALRRSLLLSFLLFDQGARCYPPARGRRFVALDPLLAERYYCAFANSPAATLRTLAKLLKGLITMHYYDLPTVKAGLDYKPESYMARVARRRLDRYTAAIVQGETAIFAGNSDPQKGSH